MSTVPMRLSLTVTAILLGVSAIARSVAAEHAELSGVARLQADARALAPGVESPWVRRFLANADTLPTIAERVVFQDPQAKKWLSNAAAARLAPDARARLRTQTLGEDFYYNTRYGSPLAYARPLDLLARAGVRDVAGRRVLDFGCGGIGHLRLLASLGAEVVGVDVDTLLPALYDEPTDHGRIVAPGGAAGSVRLFCGRWPAEDEIRRAVGEGFDVIISKNTLKNGYIHPAELVDKRMLVDLGVDDETFVRAAFQALRPGGRLLIYNLSPAQNPPGKPYIPWADGRCPFKRSLWESAGFRVLEFDVDDGPAARQMGRLLGWDRGEGKMDLERDLFAHYTLVERPTR